MVGFLLGLWKCLHLEKIMTLVASGCGLFASANKCIEVVLREDVRLVCVGGESLWVELSGVRGGDLCGEVL